MKSQIDSSALYWATFNRFELRIPGGCVLDCSGPGDASGAVDYWAPEVAAQMREDNFPLAPTPDKIRAELEEYSAWDAEELQDDDLNWRRLVWIAACNIAEDDAPDSSKPVSVKEVAS